MPFSLGGEYRQEVVVHTRTEDEYAAPIATNRAGMEIEERESMHLLTPESYPLLNSRDFDVEASEQLQIEAAWEPIE